jgi:hypothetical protein
LVLLPVSEDALLPYGKTYLYKCAFDLAVEREDLQMPTLFKLVKGEVIPVAGRGGPYGCETLRLPYYLDNRLTDDGDAEFHYY